MQGFAIGGGLVQTLGGGVAVGGHTMYGLADHAWMTSGVCPITVLAVQEWI